MVNLRIGQLTATKLEQFNSKHQFKTYPGMGHSSSEMVSKVVDLYSWTCIHKDSYCFSCSTYCY